MSFLQIKNKHKPSVTCKNSTQIAEKKDKHEERKIVCLHFKFLHKDEKKCYPAEDNGLK